MSTFVTHPWRVVWGHEGIACRDWTEAMRRATEIASSPSAPRPRVFRWRARR